MIISVELAPGDVLREADLQQSLGVGRTPLREALQRLAREHFVDVIPRRGTLVSGIDVSELSMLFETRTILEPYAARLAAARGTSDHWAEMEAVLSGAEQAKLRPDQTLPADQMLRIDRQCHEIMWSAADNRFLLDPLDALYAQSDRLWHLYLTDVPDMTRAVAEHVDILHALQTGDGERAAGLVENHIRSFDAAIRAAVTANLASPLA
jgi:DNA-binding GntR family transcriptional regulator